MPSVRVAVISGRPASFIWERLERLEHLTYIGLYGAETVAGGVHSVLADAAARRSDINCAVELLRADPTIVQSGAFIEEKGLSVAVHLRRVAERARWNVPVRDAVISIGEKCGLETLGGKLVWELRPDLDFDKGTAVREFVARTGANALIAVGDDIGDLSAFRAAHDMRSDRFRVACIAVDSSELPPELDDAADLTVSGPHEVAEILNAIADVQARAEPRPSGEHPGAR
jgi:trehalose 6-phosphate phosphatase